MQSSSQQSRSSTGSSVDQASLGSPQGPSTPSRFRDRSPLRSPLRSPRQQTTPGQTIYFDCIGYICNVGNVRTSHADNDYVLVNLKTSPNNYLTIKVMNARNENLLKVQKETAVKLYQVAEKKGTYFFNRMFRLTHDELTYKLEFDPEMPFTDIVNITPEMNGQEVHIQAHFFWVDDKVGETPKGGKFRNPLLKDKTDEIRFTVWGRLLMSELTNNEMYKFARLVVRKFGGAKVESHSNCTIDFLEKEAAKIAAPDLSLYSVSSDIITLQNPVINSTVIGKEHKCITCRSAVKPEENNLFVKSLNIECNRRFLKRKAVLEVNGIIDLQVDEIVLSLTFGGKIIKNLVDLELGTTGAMEEKVLVLDGSCKITYNKRQLTMECIEANDDWMDVVTETDLLGVTPINNDDANQPDGGGALLTTTNMAAANSPPGGNTQDD